MGVTKIQWVQSKDGTPGKTWNPVTGCDPVSPGCKNCYARTFALRLQGMGNEKYKHGFEVAIHRECFEEPTHWKKPSTILVCSMADLFHDEIPDKVLDDLFRVMLKNFRHKFLVLTKRVARMNKYFLDRPVPPNVWLGVTVENDYFRNRIDSLGAIQTPNRFISFEPLIGDVGKLALGGIAWVVTGGETGTQAREARQEWFENISDQCGLQGVKYFFKKQGYNFILPRPEN